jgi:hypothetical protein
MSYLLARKHTHSMTIKDSSKNLVGQPIFKQLIDFIPKDPFLHVLVTQPIV